MPKKSPEKEIEEARLIAWYKWEFLRRNANYRREQDAFMRKFGDWFLQHGCWYDQEIEPWGKKNLRFFAQVIAPEAKLICKKWQVRDPYPPDWNFTRSGVHEYKPEWEAYLPTDCSQSEIDAAWDFSFLLMSETSFRKSLPEKQPTVKRLLPDVIRLEEVVAIPIARGEGTHHVSQEGIRPNPSPAS